MLFERKELRLGSGGDGAMRGGDGQIIQFRLQTEDEWLLNAVASRVDKGPEGLGGGAPGAAGKFHINGQPVRDSRSSPSSQTTSYCSRRRGVADRTSPNSNPNYLSGGKS